MIANGQNLIPLPVRSERTEGQFLIDRNTAIYNSDFPKLTDYLNDHIEQLCRYRLPSGEAPEQSRIVFEKGEGPSEGYTLTVTPQRITIRGNDRGGAFYALQTLFQLMPDDIYRTDESATVREECGIPCYTIEDAPRFAYRGVNRLAVAAQNQYAALAPLRRQRLAYRDKKAPGTDRKGSLARTGRGSAPVIRVGQQTVRRILLAGGDSRNRSLRRLSQHRDHT